MWLKRGTSTCYVLHKSALGLCGPFPHRVHVGMASLPCLERGRTVPPTASVELGKTGARSFPGLYPLCCGRCGGHLDFNVTVCVELGIVMVLFLVRAAADLLLLLLKLLLTMVLIIILVV